MSHKPKKKFGTKSGQPFSGVLHFAIETKNYYQLDKIIQKTTTHADKIELNVKNQSAVAVALKTKFFCGYELLIKNGFRLGPDEKFHEIVDGFDDEDKENLRDIHIECANKPNQDYLEVIYSKCNVIHTTSEENREKFEGLKVDVFKKLAVNEWIALLLKVIALSDTLQIVFDFDRDSVDHIDPTMNVTCQGLCFHHIGDILIGARGLLSGKPDEVCKVIGVLVHEISHYVMQLVYGNDTKPYHEFDSVNETKFDKISKECEINKNLEEIIRLAFIYKDEHQNSELIVRVVQLIVKYSSKEDHQKLSSVQKNFSELFEYFEEKVVKDLKIELPKIEAKLKVKEINEICGLHFELEYRTSNFKSEYFQSSFIEKLLREKIQIFTSNCVRLTMKAIFTVFSHQSQLDGKIFVKAESLKNEKINEMIMRALKMFGHSMIVLECSENDKNLTNIRQSLTENHQNTRIIFVFPKNDETVQENTNEVEHSWEDLTTTSQEKLLKRKVNFQGFRVELSRIMIKNSEAIKLIDLNQLIHDNKMLIGKELEFDESKVYIARKFLKLDQNQTDEPENPLGFDKTFFKNKTRKLFLLIDEAGSGKSTEFIKIAKKLKKKFPSHWVTYVDLKKQTEAFLKNGNTKVDGFEETASYLAQKVFKLKNFEIKLFTELFEADRVIFLFDGVDEISPSFNEFVIKLLENIEKKSQNQLWIASRPHLVEKLEMKLKVESFKFMKFSETDRNIFFQKFFDSFDTKLQKQIFSKISHLLFRIENFKLYWNNSERKVLNPMLLNMIAELFKDNQDFEPFNANLFSIYDDFIQKLFKKLSEKGHDAIEDSVNFMRKVKINDYHQKKAFEHIFSYVNQSVFNNLADADIEERLKIAEIFRDVKDISINQQTRIGIIISEDSGNFNFIHQTFAEFFIAQYFFEEVFEKNLVHEKVGRLFCQIVSNEKLDVVRRFLQDQLDVFEINESLEIIKTLQNYFETRQELTFRQYWEKDLPGIVEQLLNEKCLGLVKLILISLKNLKENNEDLVNAWSKALQRTTTRSSLHFIRNLWTFAEELFSKDQLKKILMQENQNGQNILNQSIENEDENVFKFYFEKGRECLIANDLELFVLPKNPLWNSFEIQRALNRCEKYLEKKDFQKLLVCLGQDRYTLLHKSALYNDDSFQVTAVTLKQNLLPKEIKVLMLKVTSHGETFLMKAAESKDSERFLQVWKFSMENFTEKKLNESLLQENKQGRNVLLHSALNNFPETFKLVREIYQTKFGTEKIKEILGQELNFGANILNIAALRLHLFSFKRLWNYMENLFGSEKLKEMMVQYCNYSSSGLIFEEFSISMPNLQVVQSFILKSCTNSTSTETLHFWLFAANFSLLEFFEKLTNRVEKNPEFAKLFYKKLFRFKSKKNKNIFKYAANNSDQKMMDYKMKNVENTLVYFLNNKSASFKNGF